MGSYFWMHIGGDQEENMLLLRSEIEKETSTAKLILDVRKKEIGQVVF